ncbi:hypothetical protein BC827DRAFT_706877 [Russula dissimulans]|nr:hypothetical protein BC827DRAFT_706877 [Russula dissimulans]
MPLHRTFPLILLPHAGVSPPIRDVASCIMSHFINSSPSHTRPSETFRRCWPPRRIPKTGCLVLRTPWGQPRGPHLPIVCADRVLKSSRHPSPFRFSLFLFVLALGIRSRRADQSPFATSSQTYVSSRALRGPQPQRASVRSLPGSHLSQSVSPAPDAGGVISSSCDNRMRTDGSRAQPSPLVGWVRTV